MKKTHVGRRYGRAAAVAAVTSAMVLAGCGSSSSGAKATGNSSAATTARKGQISGDITYFWWGDPVRNQKTDAVIKLFEKAYPKVHVTGEEEAFTQYWEKVSVEASAKDLPCVTQTQDRELTSYTNDHVFLDLTNLYKSGAIDVKGMPTSIVKSGDGLDGNPYMVPYGGAFDVLMYNETEAGKAGLGRLTNDMTWAQLNTWLTKAKASLPKSVYPIMQDGTDADVFITYAESHGYSLFNSKGQLGFPASLLDSYWSMWEKWAKEGIALPEKIAASEPSTIETGELVTNKVLVEEEPANQLYDAQVQATTDHEGTLTTVLDPSGPKGIGNVIITSGLSIPASCNDIPAAAAFINFFTNNAAGAKIYASDNGVVTDTALAKDQEDSSSINPDVKQQFSEYNYMIAHHAPVILYPPGFTDVFETLYPQVFEKIADGQESVQSGVTSFMSQAKVDLSS